MTPMYDQNAGAGAGYDSWRRRRRQQEPYTPPMPPMNTGDVLPVGNLPYLDQNPDGTVEFDPTALTPGRGRGGRHGGYYPGMPGRERRRWPEETMLPEPTIPGELPGTAKPSANSESFWTGLTNLLVDPADDSSFTADDIAMVREMWESDPKWHAPTSSKATRLMGLATTFKKMGYSVEQLGDVIGQLFEMGYTQPKWQLSLFSSLLKPYGLGSSGSGGGGSDTNALLAQLGLR